MVYADLAKLLEMIDEVQDSLVQIQVKIMELGVPFEDPEDGHNPDAN
jgi:tryptophan synthase alpha subunit